MQNQEAMKKVSLLLFVLSVVVAVAAYFYPEKPQLHKYLISCTVSDAYNGKTVYLMDKNSEVYVDSCVVVDSLFKFEGVLETPAVFEVVVNRIKGIRATVIVHGEANVDVDMTVRPAEMADNGGYNDKYASLNAYAKKVNRRIGEDMQRLLEEGKTQAEADSILQPSRDLLNDVFRRTISDNKDNMYGAYFLAVVASELYETCNELDSVFAVVKYSAGLGPLVDLRSTLYQREITPPGNMFIDFTAFASDGSVAKFSDYIGKGKYVLVDYWASWCGPCRDELPNFIAISEKYTNDKFMVLGVNICDFEANFKEAMATIAFGYPQMFVPRNNEDNVVKMYDVGTIPHAILFGPDGTILERGMLGEELVKTVERYLK